MFERYTEKARRVDVYKRQCQKKTSKQEEEKLSRTLQFSYLEASW